MPSPIEARLAAAGQRLNVRRRHLIEELLANPDETFFLSSRALADRFGVDPATIVRTIQALGYERFADFAADLRQHFVARLTPYAIMRATARERRSVTDRVRHSLERDFQNLADLRTRLDAEQVVELARRIHRSRRILVVGVDLAASLASFLAYGLVPLGFAAEAPAGSAGNLYHKVRVLTPRDLLIAVSFGRCLKETVDAVRRARARGVPTFGITDNASTPIARYSDARLVASIAASSFIPSYVAPMALSNAILVACAHVTPRRSLVLLRQSEKEYTSGPRWYSQAESRDGVRKTERTARQAAGTNQPFAEEPARGRTPTPHP